MKVTDLFLYNHEWLLVTQRMKRHFQNIFQYGTLLKQNKPTKF